MLKRIAKIACMIFLVAGVSIAPCGSANLSPATAAEHVAAKLRSVNSVEFYFLSRTEEWNYDQNQLIRESSIRVFRGCGANCANFMEPVLGHLRDARPFKCNSGNQDVLIRAQGVELIYSNSGRQIRLGSQCFFNERGIRGVVGGGSMLFGSKPSAGGAGPGANNSFKPKPLRGSA